MPMSANVFQGGTFQSPPGPQESCRRWGRLKVTKIVMLIL